MFRNRGQLQRKDVWLYNKEELDIVDELNHFGMMFNYNGKFFKTQKHSSEKGRKALFSICAVFYTYVTNVILYASEIWGWRRKSIC